MLERKQGYLSLQKLAKNNIVCYVKDVCQLPPIESVLHTALY